MWVCKNARGTAVKDGCKCRKVMHPQCYNAKFPCRSISNNNGSRMSVRRLKYSLTDEDENEAGFVEDENGCTHDNQVTWQENFDMTYWKERYRNEMTSKGKGYLLLDTKCFACKGDIYCKAVKK